jgi:hypothetical protein
MASDVGIREVFGDPTPKIYFIVEHIYKVVIVFELLSIQTLNLGWLLRI